MRNVPLLEATMRQIADHPELHNQGSWFSETQCGTAACFAGWACLLAGYERSNWSTQAVRVNGVAASAGQVAQELLGLTDTEAAQLFYAGNTRRALELMVKDLANGEELRYAEEYCGE